MKKKIIEIEKCVGGYLYYQLIPYFEAENLLNPKIELVGTIEACGGGKERFRHCRGKITKCSRAPPRGCRLLSYIYF